MCARYKSVLDAARLQQFFKSRVAREIADLKDEVFPGYSAPFIRRPREWESGDEAVPGYEAEIGVFGLLPHWAKDEKLARSTYNARSETVASKPAFRDAWNRAQHCIIPAEAFWEPDWRSGKNVWTRIQRTDCRPLGIAGLWSSWRSPQGRDIHSFTMLTINADTHPLMCRYHRPDDEKRMIVLLREEDFAAWLDAPAGGSMEFMRACAPDTLVAAPESPADVALPAAQLSLS